MRRQFLGGLVVALTALCILGYNAHLKTEAAMATEPMLAHNVFFTLKDNSPAAKQKLVDACKKYLSNHPGTEYFAAGVLADQYKREVNDRNFDVGLHLVFKNAAAHDKYQDAETHKRFIEENKENWKTVRVFDSLIEK